MKIDFHTHIMPRKYLDAVNKYLPSSTRPRYEAVRTLWDMDMRFRIMDKYPGLVHVLTPSGEPLELITKPKKALELAMICNDEMAELVNKYPDRFIAAVACLPMNDIDNAIKEARRAIDELKFKGIFIQLPIFNGPKVTKSIDREEFRPIFKLMTELDLPIWLHPFRLSSFKEYSTESESKYAIYHIFGWPYETTAAMTHIVMSGLLDQYPSLKVATHHCGAMVPYFAQRLAGIYDFYDKVVGTKMAELPKPPIEYFRLFYNDTALYGNTPALMCAYSFFNADHIVFATDFPYGPGLGDKYTEDTIVAVDEMSITSEEKQKIFSENAKRLLRL